jgi:c-di-GMP-binding flagellar brake protein YcgR
MAQGRIKTERREAERFALSRKITYEVSTDPTLHSSGTAARDGALILNVSEGGVCLSTRKALKPEQIIKIDLPLAAVKTTVPTLAEVRWVSKNLGKGGHQAGLRFLL